MKLDGLDDSIVSSTVPELAPEWTEMARRYLGHEMPVVGPGIRTGMPIRMDNPRELGADRLVNAVAAYEIFQTACIVVDFGTAITYDVVSERRRVPRRDHRAGHGDLARGALGEAAKLPNVEIGAPRIADRQVDRRRDPLRRSSTASQPGRRDHRPPARRAGDRRAGDRDRRPRPRIVPFTESIGESTSCSRSRACS